MRSGPYLVTAARATLPPVCPICGKPSNGKNVLRRIAVMESFSMRKMLTNVDLEMSFCGWHDRVRRTAEICQFILTGTAVALGIGLLVLETTLPSFRGHWWLIAGAGGLLSLVIGGGFGVIATRGPRPYR